MYTPDDYARKAALLWNVLTPNERALVNIGVFPADAMRAAEREGYEIQPLAVALMSRRRDPHDDRP